MASIQEIHRPRWDSPEARLGRDIRHLYAKSGFINRADGFAEVNWVGVAYEFLSGAFRSGTTRVTDAMRRLGRATGLQV